MDIRKETSGRSLIYLVGNTKIIQPLEYGGAALVSTV